MHWFLPLLLFTGTYGLFQPTKVTNYNMVDCVIEIVNEYVERRTVVLYTEEEHESELWVHTIRNIKKPFMVVSQKRKLRDTDMLVIVLFPHTDTNYTSLLQRLRKDTLYVIVGTEKFNWHHMTTLLSQFHNTKMIHDVLLIPSEEKIDVYTSFPYSANHCSETGPPVKIDSFVMGNFEKRINLFNTGKYWNMHGCTLTCLANRQPPEATITWGKDGEIFFKEPIKDLVNLLQKKLNFKLQIILPESRNLSLQQTWYFYNDTVQQITEYLSNGKADFAMGVFSRLLFTNDSSIIFGKETRFECYTWAVPIRAGKKRSIIMNYIDEFSVIFWMLFIISIIIAVFIIVGITTILKEHTSLQSPLNAFQYIFSTILNQPYPVRPKPWSLRVFIGHWLVYVLVITTAYQASLWSFMTIPWQVHNIQNLQDLLESNLEIGGAQQMLNILKSLKSSNENINKMIQRFKVLPPSDFHDIIHRIHTKRDFAVFGEKTHLSSYSKDTNKSFDKDKVYFVDGCLIESLATPLLFPVGSPLFKPINSMLLRILQSGLYTKFRKPNGEENHEESSNRQAGFEVDSAVMSLVQLKGIFIILLFGYGISFVAFCLEIIVSNISLQSQRVKVIIGPKLYHRDS